MAEKGKRGNWLHVLFRAGMSAGVAAGVFTGMCALTGCGKVPEEAGSCFAGDKSIEEAHSEESSGGEETETDLPEEILQQSREEFYDRAKRYESLSGQETDALYRRLLESRVMEREQMHLTGMVAGDYDGNGQMDMVVCLYSLAEDADTYGDGCLYLFMNEEEPCRIYEENCCYGFGFITGDFGADLDGDGKTEVVIQIQGTGNGGWGDFCGFVVKYENPGIRKMELPDDMADDCGIQVTVAGDPGKGVYTAYCGALDETIEFSADREVDDMRGGNSRGYLLEKGEYRGEEVLLGYEYLYAGGIIEYVGAAVFVLGWDAEGSPYIRDWYIEGDTAAARASISARTAFESFLKGSLLRFTSEDISTWRLDTWKNTILPLGGLEYAYLDLDGDGVEELLVQYADCPEAYNGVFHYGDGMLYCWQSDAVEMTCRDYPLRDGTMVRQYDSGGVSSYTLFRYRADGGEEKLTSLFSRTELPDPDSTEPCPYYEVGGREVDREEFEEQLKRLVTEQRLDAADWTAL